MENFTNTSSARAVTLLSATPARARILKKLRARPSVRCSLIALVILIAFVALAPFFFAARSV